mmetsp:Transcript_8086/g.13044  ORF Transcript_8086/g.13044 Transcript_8086/m.13044 type:complete len:163 (+) Transcript_8086:166-654(+)
MEKIYMKTAILLEELRQLTENDPAQTESYGPNKEHIIAQLVSDDEAPLNLRQELNDIFYYYSSFGQTDATDTLGSANFRRCVNDCRIPSTRIKPGEIDVLFCKAVGGSGKRMTFDLFCKALCLLSLREFDVVAFLCCSCLCPTVTFRLHQVCMGRMSNLLML